MGNDSYTFGKQNKVTQKPTNMDPQIYQQIKYGQDRQGGF